MPHGPFHFQDFLDILGDSPAPPDTGINVGGGINEALIGLSEEELAFKIEGFRQGFGADLLQQLVGMQNNPFSLVPALQAYGAAGGGTLAPAAAFDATGGAGAPSPYGNLVQELLAGLSDFALGRGGQGGDDAPSTEDTSLPPGFGPPGPDNPFNDPEAVVRAVTANVITALKGYKPSTPLDAAAVLSQLDQMQAAGYTTIGGVAIEAVIDIISRAAADPKSTDPAEVLKMIAAITAGWDQAPGGSGAPSQPESGVRDIYDRLLGGALTPEEAQRLLEEMVSLPPGQS